MSKLWLIIQREYMSIVAKKSFIIMTLLMPFLIIIIGAIPGLLAYFNDSSSTTQETYTVIDETGMGYAQAITDIEGYNFVNFTGDKQVKPRQVFDNAGGSISGVIIIPANITDSQEVTIYSTNTIPVNLKSHINRCINDTLTAVKIASFGVPDLERIISEAHVDVNVNSVRWNADGQEENSSTEAAAILGLILAFITYMFVLMYGAMIMNNVIEEKTNRIVEVIVSSCKPFQLMMGKIIGVALAGLTQFFMWVVMALIVGTAISAAFGIGTAVTGTGLPATGTDALTDTDTISSVMQAVMSINYAYIISTFVLYFIGGYLLYAALFAGFGSAVDEASDASQFTTPIMLLMVVALYAGIACIENPNGQMALWCSIIPFTSPVVMMVRLPYDVPLWQLALSIVILFATAALMVWLSGRIYRNGILMYGKKSSLKQILKWLK